MIRAVNQRHERDVTRYEPGRFDNDFWSGYPIREVAEHDQQVLRSQSVGIPFAAGDFEAPAEIDPRGWMVVENQGAVGSCQGHALSSGIEYCYKVKRGIESDGHPLQFSRQMAYIGTQMIDGINGDRGSTLSGGAKLAKEKGICRESVCPYPGRYSREIPEAAWEDAENYKIGSVSWVDSYNDIHTYLAAGLGPVEIGIIWDRECQSSRGVIDNYTGRGNGGHAILLCGYTESGDIWLLNSHTTRWGENGWARVTRRAIEAMCRSNFFSAFGMSDLSVDELKPRKFWESHSIFGHKR